MTSPESYLDNSYLDVLAQHITINDHAGSSDPTGFETHQASGIPVFTKEDILSFWKQVHAAERSGEVVDDTDFQVVHNQESSEDGITESRYTLCEVMPQMILYKITPSKVKRSVQELQEHVPEELEGEQTVKEEITSEENPGKDMQTLLGRCQEKPQEYEEDLSRAKPSEQLRDKTFEKAVRETFATENEEETNEIKSLFFAIDYLCTHAVIDITEEDMDDFSMFHYNSAASIHSNNQTVSFVEPSRPEGKPYVNTPRSWKRAKFYRPKRYLKPDRNGYESENSSLFV